MALIKQNWDNDARDELSDLLMALDRFMEKVDFLEDHFETDLDHIDEITWVDKRTFADVNLINTMMLMKRLRGVDFDKFRKSKSNSDN